MWNSAIIELNFSMKGTALKWFVVHFSYDNQTYLTINKYCTLSKLIDLF